MANQLNFGSKVVFLNGYPFTAPSASIDPAFAVAGDVYYNNTSNVLRYYNGTAWGDIDTGGGGGGISWVKYTFTYSNFSTTANTNTLSVVTLAAKTIVTGVMVKHSTAFSGGSITDYTVSLTDGGSWNYSGGTFDVFQAVSDAAYQSVQQQHPVGFSTSGTIYIVGTSVGDTLNNATAGSVDVWIKTETLP